jgi:hypothetical protein
MNRYTHKAIVSRDWKDILLVAENHKWVHIQSYSFQKLKTYIVSLMEPEMNTHTNLWF